MKDRLIGPDFTWSKFVEELRGEFYPVTIQQEKEKEFSELRMIDNMVVLYYASKFTELPRFVPEFVAAKRMKTRRFEEGLAFYIRK